ncbi:mechanosensitive ion channel [Vibrio sp.]|nr:mechanosensitive ion channel [Vibrio sp.]
MLNYSLDEWIQYALFWLQQPIIFRIILGILLVFAYRLTKRVSDKTIHQLAVRKNVKSARISFILHFSHAIIFLIYFSIFSVSTGIGYGDLSLLFSSMFAILGVALFAQWSMLSNVTASFLIFFFFPYRVGTHIKVVDKDEDISGEIVEIQMFYVLIKRKDGHLITYPSSLLLQKSVIRPPNSSTQPDSMTSSKKRLYRPKK